MSSKRLRPQVLADRRGARKKWDCDNPYVATSYRFVNILRFHLQPLAGLFLAGGWCDLLTLWCPLLDMAARALRDAIGGRI